MTTRYTYLKSVIVLIITAFLFTPATAQTGHILNGVGAVDQGMSGAGMAAPGDALTALNTNPAAISLLNSKTLDFGFQLMMPSSTVTSAVQPGGFGPFGPPALMNGATDSEAGPFPIPSLAFVYRAADSPWTFGLGAVGVGGFGVDYVASSPTAPGANPILTPQMPNGGMGFGAMESAFMLLQISPTIAFQVNDRVSIGASPVFNLANLELSVMPGAAPQFIDVFGTPGIPQDDLPLYPDAPATWARGYGFQVGIQAMLSDDLSAAISYKSTMIFDDFEYEPTTPGAADYTFAMDVPMIISGGLAFTGVDGLTLAADVRFIDYENTTGFDEVGFGPDMAVLGFGWESITVVALGAEYDVTNEFAVRAGYANNNSPIGDDISFFNAPAPALVEHHVSAGFSYQLSDKLTFSMAGQYAPTVEVEGMWQNPTFPPGGNPATSITNELSTLTVIGGMSVTF